MVQLRIVQGTSDANEYGLPVAHTSSSGWLPSVDVSRVWNKKSRAFLPSRVQLARRDGFESPPAFLVQTIPS